MKKMYSLALALASVVFATNAQQASQNLWHDEAKPATAEQVSRTWLPTDYRYMHVDINALKLALATAPDELNVTVKNSSFVLELPMPDGNVQKFKLVYSPFMHRDLAAVYPQIKTFTGQGIDDASATIKCDYTQFGFHAFVLAGDYTVYIDPVNLNNTEDYIIYYKHNSGRVPSFTCETEDKMMDANSLDQLKGGGALTIDKSIGTQLRTYRLALACTGEYSAVFGGTKANSLAAMNTSMNRVNGVYEKEVCIHMTLVPNDTVLIFLNAATDGYTNNSGGTMLGENQTKCNSLIGTANYDMGHVFSTGGGGIASLGCICSANNKAKGVTGLPSPSGDGFDIDYVAHEMGHQFGGNHTFNCTTGSCGGGNVATSAAYEPGSGITIMAYAGICGSSDNLAAHSIPTFHTKSFDEIVTYSQTGNGNTCAVNTPTGNDAPVLTIQANFTIPYKTPFRLVTSATDPNGDPLKFSWEQYDLGPQGSWNVPTGNAPLFQPYNPVVSGTRLCPKLSNILTPVANGATASRGEWVPDYARTLKFRCTARDSKVGGGGVTHNDTPVQLTVVNTGTGFKVTSPNTTGISWPALSSQTITWDVAGTTGNGINCANVNIWLSTDGGQTFPFAQATAVPNTGSYTGAVLNNQSTTCRYMIEGDGNVFFDINDKNFTISVPSGIVENELSQFVTVTPNPSAAVFSFAINNNKINGDVTIEVYDATGRMVTKTSSQILGSDNIMKVDMSGMNKGVYEAVLKSNAGVASKRLMKL